ncbi:MAG: nitrite reductase [Comamonas sp.]|uniref:nitrite reductase n=1 Tax=Comamonas sp. TaxID=34028 RepID=UPI002818178D|nr:nitrite reductase [Comamonas sp.]MDR0213180.1 nitrite reductase [Comamonas sp.]
MADPVKVQGWCPTAWQPMQAQDGWIVRIRPHCASISAAQWSILSGLALSHAHPQLELTRLGNVQLRGIEDAQLTTLRSRLIDAGLVPADADADLAPAVHCSPFYQAGDLTHELAGLLSAAVAEHLSPRALQLQGIAVLPSKFGLLVDDPAQSLASIPADLRLWVQPGQAERRYGLSLGSSDNRYDYASAAELLDATLQVSIWFARQRMSAGGTQPTRLQQLLKTRQPELSVLQIALQQAAVPGAQAFARLIKPGWHGHDRVIGATLGRVDALAMQQLADSLPVQTEIRVTPWRSLLLIGHEHQAVPPNTVHWITDAADARNRVSACTGSPRCTQALIPAQALALQFAPHTRQDMELHISGCPKLCALPGDATTVVFASTGNTGQLLLNAGPPGRLANPSIQIPCKALPSEPAGIQELIHELSI